MVLKFQIKVLLFSPDACRSSPTGKLEHLRNYLYEFSKEKREPFTRPRVKACETATVTILGSDDIPRATAVGTGFVFATVKGLPSIVSTSIVFFGIKY